MTQDSYPSTDNKPRNLTVLYIVAMVIVLAVISVTWIFLSRQRQAQEMTIMTISKSNDLKVQFAQADAYLKAGIYDQAQIGFENLIRQEPEFPGAIEKLSEAVMLASFSKLTAEAPTATPIPTETPTPLPTLTPMPSPTATEMLPPTLTPTNTPVGGSNIPSNALFIYVTKLGTGDTEGCGDSVVPVYIGRVRSGDLKTDLKTVLDALFAAGHYPSGLYNATYPSNLVVDSVEYKVWESRAYVQLNGNYVSPADACDAKRYHAQVWSTAYQFEEIKKFTPYVGDSLLGDRLAVYSDSGN